MDNLEGVMIQEVKGGLDRGPLVLHKPVGIIRGHFHGLHDVGYGNGGRAGDANQIVDDNLAAGS
jgi:hypothetical protein